LDRAGEETATSNHLLTQSQKPISRPDGNRLLFLGGYHAFS
jgi:hypothetical protein